MKIFYLIIFLPFFLNAQSSDTFTTLEFNDVASTSNNSTSINLFTLNFSGGKIPINLFYPHDGLQINEISNSVGLKWEIQPIGKISRIVNDQLDNKENTGWFNSVTPNFTPSSWAVDCTTSQLGQVICQNGSGIYQGLDLAPDFFLVNAATGMDFSFVYNKFSGGPLAPVILSNKKEYQINTNFSFFPNVLHNYQTSDQDVVFNIIDTDGTQYNFINGPLNVDATRSSEGDYRNEYYLQEISNPTKTSEKVMIYYRPTIKGKDVHYGSGYNDCQGSQGSADCTTVIRNHHNDFYYSSHNRYDIDLIVTPEVIVDFIYSTDGSDILHEIDIKGKAENFITGFKFTYSFDNVTGKTFLSLIEKWNTSKSDKIILYEFDYFNNNPGFNISDLDFLGDSFGYFNKLNATSMNSFPFPITVSDTQGGISVLPAANLNPNLYYAKFHSLKSIKHKFGNLTEFNYRLNVENCALCYGDIIYGGGLLIDYKKTTSDSAPAALLQYQYEGLSGNVLNMTAPILNYAQFNGSSELFWSSRPELINTINFYSNNLVNQIQNVGNFYSRVTESMFDFSTMELLSKVEREYVPNKEGVYVSPLLKKETYKDGSNQIVKELEYFYTENHIQTLPFGSIRTEFRNIPVIPITRKFIIKNYLPIDVTKVSMTERRERTYTLTNVMTSSTFFSYTQPWSNAVRSVNQITSLGDNYEDRYYYPGDSQLSTFPNIHLLLTSNRIGEPLKTETYKTNVKTYEYFTYPSIDISTGGFLLPKYEYRGKFPNNLPLLANIGNLEKIQTYDLYDSKGNILQFTKENGVPTSYIWGYNQTKIVATIDNLGYNNIPVARITAIQNASNVPDNENNILLALDLLRGDAALANSMITTKTYNPLVGVSTITDIKGQRSTYTYDAFGRLSTVKDFEGNILTENVYNLKSQN